VVEINLPSLRQRQQDIPLLIEHFLKNFNTQFSKHIRGISTDTLNVLMLHSWPGNIRELENTLEHAFVRCQEDVITVNHLPPAFAEFAPKLSTEEEPDPAWHEAKRVRWALRKSAWNKSRAAELLGMSRRTIYRKIYHYNITPEP